MTCQEKHIHTKRLASVKGSVVSDSLRPHGLWTAWLLCPWNSPGKNTGVGCHSLLQRIFQTQGSNSGLLHCRQIFFFSSEPPWGSLVAQMVRGKSLRKLQEAAPFPSTPPPPVPGHVCSCGMPSCLPFQPVPDLVLVTLQCPLIKVLAQMRAAEDKLLELQPGTLDPPAPNSAQQEDNQPKDLKPQHTLESEGERKEEKEGQVCGGPGLHRERRPSRIFPTAVPHLSGRHQYLPKMPLLFPRPALAPRVSSPGRKGARDE